MKSSSDPLPSSTRSLGRSLRLGYQASPLLIVVAFATTIAAAVPDALLAAGLALLVHAVVTDNGSQITVAVTFLGVLATGSWLLKIVSDRANRRFADRAAVFVESHVARLQATVTTLEHQERPDYLDRISVLREHAGALSYLYQELFSAIGAVIRLVLTLVLLMSVDPALGLLAAAAVPGVLVSHWRSRIDKETEEAVARHHRRARHLFTLATTPATAAEVRVAGVQQWLYERRNQAWHQRYAPIVRAKWVSTMWQVATHAVFAAAFIVAVARVAGRSGSDATDTLLVLAAGSRLAQYVGQTVHETQFYRSIWLDVSRRLTWLEDLAQADRVRSDLVAPDRLNHGIRLENVSFRYPWTERLVLDDITIELPAGKVIAIVGENGAGKTTLVKLLCKLYAPTTGRISVDGIDLDRIPPDQWRERVSGAFQDFFQLEYPVRESVGVGDIPRIDDHGAVWAALARAGTDDMVANLPHGLDTQLGPSWDQGVNLSHGQWQKIALARGFMRDDPFLLILDEPTSALDADVEHALFERFAEAARSNGNSQQTTVLVSHRFSTVRMADLIVVMDGARLVEYGSHTQLMARQGHYYELYNIQASAYQTRARP